MTKESVSYEQAQKTFFDLFPKITLMGVIQEPENIRLLLWAQDPIFPTEEVADSADEIFRTQKEWDDLFRLAIFGSLSMENYNLLFQRMIATEVGVSGHVTDSESAMAREQGFEKLSDFEKFLFKPTIEAEQERHKATFKFVFETVTGEDWPNDDGLYRDS